ncbi:MAG: hypothetical protein IT445_10400 [Phycisphaeraceae bacterium]|nr:hypothetical protein [Phycisphaeraceae bacterium]
MRHILPLTVLILLASPWAAAHDTDQFSMPPQGQELADMGAYVNAQVVEAVQKGIDSVNKRIREVVERDLRSVDPGSRPPAGQYYDPTNVLGECHKGDTVARAVFDAFGNAVIRIEWMERELYTKDVTDQYPGQLTAYKPRSDFSSIYNKAFLPVDPRNLTTLFFASTIKLYGVYTGTDKIGHFTDMGYRYYEDYRRSLRHGKTEDQAMEEAVKRGDEGLFSEHGFLGSVTAGSYSNADLAANFIGMLFYRNLTEPTVVKGQLCPPILVRDGEYWKLNGPPDTQFLERFISDHLNEALNPSLYQPMIRDTVRKLVAERNANLLRIYADRCTDKDPAQYFSDLVLTLSDYYGHDYGHHGEPEELVHIGNTIQPK